MMLSRASSLSRVLLALDLAPAPLFLSRPLASHSRFGKPGSRLGQTSVFVQTGLKIRELPLVVKKVNDVLCISGMDGYKRVNEPAGTKKYEVSEITEETEELIAGFGRCFSVHVRRNPTDEGRPLQ